MLNGILFLYWLVIIAFYVLNGIAFMRLSKLAGRTDIGWMAFVPICNVILQLILIKKSGWWILICLVPIVNIVFLIIWHLKLLQAYGKHGAFVLFAIFLPPVYEILWIVWGLSSETRYMWFEANYANTGMSS